MHMIENENNVIADLIGKISPYVRFVGVISKNGELLAYKRREDLKPLLDQKNTQYRVMLSRRSESHFLFGAKNAQN